VSGHADVSGSLPPRGGTLLLVSVHDIAPGTARGVLDVLSRPERIRRAAARRQAELHPWSRSIEEMLAVHEDVLSACRRTVTV